MSEKQQRLVYAILEFLDQSIKDGTVKADDKEGLEVAMQCIGEAFNVDPSNEQQAEQLSVKPATLQSIFDVFMKTRDKVGAAAPSPAAAAAASSSTTKAPSAEDKSQAEKHKQAGNALMSSKKYDEAIEAYDKAVALDPTNPVYYSNRAAAYSSKGDHLAAVGDAEKALSVDPNFVKAYHRLGHAQYSLGDYQAAENAFERGLKLDPTNAGLKSGLQNAHARITSEDVSPSRSGVTTPEPSGPAGAGGGLGGLAGMADMLRGMGGGAGGMPDIASLMNNPQLMAMAQQMAANGGLANLMQNPAVANMMNRVQSGDMPSMAELMNDPSLRELADQFTGAGR
ncbi:putative homodimerisation domain of SGTA [Lyophyllum shimeji]|uniref:Homodimerisation domain of SGTA n=1 Tax=Lyophyllum shimeji TaxID=47721 RepID=A0A9P3PJI2_LYOSH|nr:putative homodimerisation domain of SGTA [Lyophyllum shimeji]